jgi:hypothetical protein
MFDDLLGGTQPIDIAPIVLDPAPSGKEFSLALADVHEINRGVTVAWLMQAFTMQRSTVTAKLADCPVLRNSVNGGKIYDLRAAAAFLVKPRLSIASYIKNMPKEDLPEQLRREYWAARQIEQKVREKAGDLWRSDDVMAVFGEVFKAIKETTQLWCDTIDESLGLTDPQRGLITVLVDDLLNSIEKSLTDLEAVSATRSQLAELDEDDGLPDA